MGEEEGMETMVTTLVAIIIVLMVVITLVDIIQKIVKGVKVVLVTMVVDITPKEVKVVVVIIPKEVKELKVTIPREGFNGNILSCVSDTTSEYKVESIFVVLALLVLILMFMQKMVQELKDALIVSVGKLYRTNSFYLYQTEILLTKKACWCLSYRAVSIL